jgi:hypothetical protein
MFRFTIRDVLWLTVVVAMGCSWWWSSFRLERAREQFQKEQIEFARKHNLPFEVRDSGVIVRTK